MGVAVASTSKNFFLNDMGAYFRDGSPFISGFSPLTPLCHFTWDYLNVSN